MMLMLISILCENNLRKLKKHDIFSLFSLFSYIYVTLLPSCALFVSSRHRRALTLINGEPSSALKARGSEWGQIKVEHRSQGREAWREERGVQDTVTNHCQRQRPRVTEGDALGGDSGASLGRTSPSYSHDTLSVTGSSHWDMCAHTLLCPTGPLCLVWIYHTTIAGITFIICRSNKLDQMIQRSNVPCHLLWKLVSMGLKCNDIFSALLK